ncbi:MAG: hypothetical protein ACE5FU_00125, partial [Nitrospinota bacterium]
SNSYQAGFNYAVSELSSLALSMAESFLFNESRQLIDSRTDSAGINYQSKLGKNLNASLGYSFSNSSFDAYDYSFSTSGENGNIRNHSVFVGFSGAVSKVAGLSLSGGYFLTEGNDPVKGWTAAADLNTALKSLTYGVGYSRSVTSSYGLTREINLNESFTAGATIALNRMVSISIDGSSARNRTEPSAAAKSRSYSGSVAAGYTPSPFWTLSTTFALYRIESTLVPEPETIKNSYDAGFNLQYQYSRLVVFKAGYSHFEERTKDFPALAFSRETAFIAVNVRSLGVANE